MRILCITLAAVFLAACGQPFANAPADTAAPASQPGFDPAELDTSIRPQDDFYAYVNRTWIESTEIPPEWSRYGTMQIVYERTEQRLKTIIQTAAKSKSAPGSDARKTGDLYNSFMDAERIEQLGLAPLAPELARIDALHTHDEVIDYFGHALSVGIAVPVDFYIDADAAQPDHALVYIWQGGLGLPDRDYYLSDSAKLAEIRDKYLAHIRKMFALAGWDGDRGAGVVMGIEAQIAEQQWSRVQNRDRQKIYSNKYTIAEADTLSPGFDWAGFLESGEFGTPRQFVIAQTDYFAALGRIVRSIPVENWRIYLRFNTLRAYAPYLGKAIVAEDFEFRRHVLRGQQQIRPRWKRGIRLVNDSLGDIVGKAYVGQYFSPEARQRIEVMVENPALPFDSPSIRSNG